MTRFRSRISGAAAALLLSAALGACSKRAEEPPPAPQILFDETTYDFGQVHQGAKVHHVFNFQNAGGSDLLIDKTLTSCGCTAAVVSEKRIPPAGKGAVDVTFDTSGMFGLKRKSVTVYSSDPLHPATTLGLHGEVMVDVAADPSEMYVARVVRGQPTAKDLHLILGDGTRVTDVTSPGRWIVASLNKDGQPPTIQLSVRPDAPLGSFRDSIDIHSSSSDTPVIHVPIFGIVEGDVTVSPPRIEFAPVIAGERASRSVVVKNSGKQPVQVKDASAPKRWADATIEPVQEGREYRVTVTLRDDVPAGRLDGTLELHTDHPEQPVVDVPISGLVRAKR